MTEAIELHERQHTERCPFCREPIAPAVSAWTCDACGTRLHADCHVENRGACTVLGCARATTVTPFAPAASPPAGSQGLAGWQRIRDGVPGYRPFIQSENPVVYPWYQGPLGLVGILLLPVLTLAFGFGKFGESAPRLAMLIGLSGPAIAVGLILVIAIFGKR